MRGIGWNYNALPDYQPVTASEKGKGSSIPEKASGRDRLRGFLSAMALWSLYSPPYVRLDIGQSTHIPSLVGLHLARVALTRYITVVLLLGYLTTLLVCITKDSQLLFNSNRAGMGPPGTRGNFADLTQGSLPSPNFHSSSSSPPKTMSSPCSWGVATKSLISFIVGPVALYFSPRASMARCGSTITCNWE
jgi:hypothetical protein